MLNLTNPEPLHNTQEYFRAKEVLTWYETAKNSKIGLSENDNNEYLQLQVRIKMFEEKNGIK